MEENGGSLGNAWMEHTKKMENTGQKHDFTTKNLGKYYWSRLNLLLMGFTEISFQGKKAKDGDFRDTCKGFPVNIKSSPLETVTLTIVSV